MIQMAMLLQWRPWHMAPGDHMGWGGWTLMLLFWLIVIGAVGWLVVALLRRDRGGPPRRDQDGRGQDPRDHDRDRAESVLRERYARDEIDEETFRRKLDELRRP